MAPSDATVPEARSTSYLFRGQALHAGALLLFAVAAGALAAPAFGPAADSWLGLSDRTWFWISVCAAILHQVVVWLGFRLQLGWGVWTRAFGARDLAAWGVLFLPLLVIRPLLVFATGMADRGSLRLPSVLAWTLGVLLLAIALYALLSVKRHFGLARALGGDHFRLAYRSLPFVREGAFRWTPNAMYLLAFLGLWAVALLLRSHVALAAALFQHAAIWGHYLGTERPDMELMYREG